jgi:hypothetical protein
MSSEAVAYDNSDRANPKRSERNERGSFVYNARQGDRGEPSQTVRYIAKESELHVGHRNNASSLHTLSRAISNSATILYSIIIQGGPKRTPVRRNLHDTVVP